MAGGSCVFAAADIARGRSSGTMNRPGWSNTSTALRVTGKALTGWRVLGERCVQISPRDQGSDLSLAMGPSSVTSVQRPSRPAGVAFLLLPTPARRRLKRALLGRGSGRAGVVRHSRPSLYVAYAVRAS